MFEELCREILDGIPSTYSIIYIACDKSISIKSSERKRRGESNKFIISSPKVRVPPNFQNFLHNVDNKQRLFELLEETWINHRHLLKERAIFLARKDVCTKITKEGSCTIEALRTNHEEADTKISFLLKHAIDNNSDINGCVVRSCSADIDIPVILIGTLGTQDMPIYIDNGTGKYRRILHLNESDMTAKQQKALIGYHAFTGNDYVSSFLTETKRTWTIIQNNEELLNLFGKLSEGNLTEDLYKGLEKFVCTIYNEKKCEGVNDARSALFWKKLHRNKKVTDILLLPPCSSSLKRHSN